jgi:hypothetical protein
MYAGGISYVSECSFGFIGRVSAEAVTIAVSETSKIENVLVDIVENFMRRSGWSVEMVKAHTTPDFRFLIPNRGAGALS